MTTAMKQAIQNIKHNPNHLFGVRSWAMLDKMKRQGLIKSTTIICVKAQPMYKKAII